MIASYGTPTSLLPLTSYNPHVAVGGDGPPRLQALVRQPRRARQQGLVCGEETDVALAAQRTSACEITGRVAANMCDTPFCTALGSQCGKRAESFRCNREKRLHVSQLARRFVMVQRSMRTSILRAETNNVNRW